MRFAIIGGLVAALALATSVQAREPSAHMLELSNRYMTAVKLNENMDAMIQTMTPMMAAEMSKDRKVPPEVASIVSETVVEIMRDEMTPRMIKTMASIVAETFTEEELTHAITFYESPLGQSMVAKQPALNAKFAPILPGLMAGMKDLMAARLPAKLCARGYCDGKKPKA